MLIRLKFANVDRLAAVLARAEELAKGRDPAEDDATLAALGVDPTNWSEEAARVLLASAADKSGPPRVSVALRLRMTGHAMDRERDADGAGHGNTRPSAKAEGHPLPQGERVIWSP
jgi:hypothetical protein